MRRVTLDSSHGTFSNVSILVYHSLRAHNSQGENPHMYSFYNRTPVAACYIYSDFPAYKFFIGKELGV